MLAMFEGVTIGIVLFAVGLLLIYFGIPRKGVIPRFLRFDPALVLYPPLALTFLVFGAAFILRAL